MSAETRLLSIGEFARMTFLSVKTLRHYHETGLLAPAHIDPSSGYRYYDVSQVATAQVIRRFRDLDLPIERLRAFLDAPDESTRNAVIVDHLDKMRAQLQETQATVDSLRRMLSDDDVAFPVAYRDEPVLTALAVTDHVVASDVVAWWMEAFAELHRAVRVTGASRTGTDGALFPTEFFADEAGELVAFVPVAEVPDRLPARVTAYDVPAARLAVTSTAPTAPSAAGWWSRRPRPTGRFASGTSPPVTRTTSSPTRPRCAGRSRAERRSRARRFVRSEPADACGHGDRLEL
jgi:DNA-binding transcriptional MerR regulator